MISAGLNLNIVNKEEKEDDTTDWKTLYIQEKLKVEQLEQKVKQLQVLYEEEQLFVEKLNKKVEELKKKVPTSTTKKVYENENEKKVALIQNSFRRRNQTSDFVKLGNFYFFI
jgi:predicted RNase H-like nuclease (RuvC/YqgF family)